MSSLQESFEKLKVDLTDLDFENIGSWPMSFKVIVCCAAFLFVLFMGFQLHLSNLESLLNAKERREDELKQEFQVKAFLGANRAVYRKQMSEMEASFGALLRQLPADTEVPGLLEDITYIGLGAGLQIDEITLMPEVLHEFYIELPIKISVRGSYHDIGTFISGVSNLPRIVTLHDFSIRKDDQQGGLVMDIQASTYRYKEKKSD